MDTFNSKKDLQKEKGRLNGSPIVNQGLKGEEKKLPDAGVARYTFTLKIIWEYMESSEYGVWTAVIRAMMSVWIGMVARFVGERYQGAMQTPYTDGRFLGTEIVVNEQTGHSDNAIKEEGYSGFFMLYYGNDGGRF